MRAAYTVVHIVDAGVEEVSTFRLTKKELDLHKLHNSVSLQLPHIKGSGSSYNFLTAATTITVSDRHVIRQQRKCEQDKDNR